MNQSDAWALDTAVNITNFTTLTNLTNSSLSSSNSSTYYDEFVDLVVYEFTSFRNSQMIMGTLFLGCVLGMVIMVLCCVKHKQDGYYRVPPATTPEELELVVNHNRKFTGEGDKFEIGIDSD